jgi:hypothetical protein
MSGKFPRHREGVARLRSVNQGQTRNASGVDRAISRGLHRFQRSPDLLCWFMTNVIDSVQEIQRSDDQLMEAVMNRESEALECIYMRYESLARTVILGVIRDESEVDDILHDVLLQVWDLGDTYQPSRRGLRGLLVTLARRRALDRLRRRAFVWGRQL